MARWHYSGWAALGLLGITAAISVVRPSLAIAPQLTTDHPLLSRLSRASGLGDLYQLRDRIQTKLDQLPDLTNPRDSRRPAHLTLAQIAQRVTYQIQLEEEAQASYNRALELGQQAIATRNQGNGEESALSQELFLWHAAIDQLKAVPPELVLADQATAKISEYEAILPPVYRQIGLARSEFLTEIAAIAGNPDRARISVCHLSGACRSFKGSEPPASPASLIKLPIAVALMQKVERDNIDLDSPIYIDPGNFTENAQGARLTIGREYPLREVMMRMIRESNNIATNQLIDYIGRPEINQFFTDLGYSQTFVDYKLIGQRIFPANAGSQPNRTTTDELTEMMRQIYTFQHPGDDVLLDALVGQYDWDFGYQALQDTSRRVHWIGEKLGQNSLVIGTTLAVKIDEERYVMTVTIDNSADQVALRRMLRAIVDHILEAGHFAEITEMARDS